MSTAAAWWPERRANGANGAAWLRTAARGAGLCRGTVFVEGAPISAAAVQLWTVVLLSFQDNTPWPARGAGRNGHRTRTTRRRRTHLDFLFSRRERNYRPVFSAMCHFGRRKMSWDTRGFLARSATSLSPRLRFWLLDRAMLLSKRSRRSSRFVASVAALKAASSCSRRKKQSSRYAQKALATSHFGTTLALISVRRRATCKSVSPKRLLVLTLRRPC